MDLLGDVGPMESRFGQFGGGVGVDVSVGARSVHGLHQMYHTLRNRFGRI
jgi:hypothetical protein